MIIDNFDKLKDFFKWEEDTFYTFKCIARKKDGTTLTTTDKREIMIKTWIIDSQEKFDQQKPNMIEFCRAFNARLYFTHDKKSVKKSYFRLLDKINKKLYESVVNEQHFGISELNKLVPSIISEEETSCKGNRYWFFDVDTKDEIFLKDLLQIIEEAYITHGDKDKLEDFKNRIKVLDSKNGYHVLAPKEFGRMTPCLSLFLRIHIDEVNMQENNIALIYADLKDNGETNE